MRLPHFGLLIWFLAAPAQAITIDWVTVGNPGNATDPATSSSCPAGGCYGGVAATYRIGKYEVTNTQYAEFLNAKATADPLGLYNVGMAAGTAGIARSGSSGNFTYSVVPGRENRPVNYVSLFDTMRFVNWIHNGQGNGDTETGSYTLLGGTAMPSNGGTITRNPGATIVLPSENEWYKAAYYDAVATSYNPYPFADGFNGSVCDSPASTTTHSANCNSAVGDTSNFGAYTTSPSAYGTFDQGGNVWERNETILDTSNRGMRGGGRGNSGSFLAAFRRLPIDPALEGQDLGFRVASVPEPGPGVLVMAGLLGMARARSRA